jgi:hypothetical protein
VERETTLILINNLGGNFLVDDFLKYRFGGHNKPRWSGISYRGYQ